MRPSPAEVRGWFAGDVTDEKLTRYLAILQADPNWHVDNAMGLHARMLTLSYSPGAERLTVALWQDGAVWHPRLIP